MKNIIFVLFVLFAVSSNAVLSANWDAKLNKAEQYFKSHEYRAAIKLYQEIAENLAHKYSQFQLGWIYSNGLGVKKDYYEAARWYSLAASQGHLTAQNNLYILYVNGGDGFPANKVKAIYWLKKSAKSGDARAQANLSNLYSTGDDVEKDEFKAFELATKSANQGDDVGNYRLAMYYYEGIGVSSDKVKSFNLMKKVANSKQEYLFNIRPTAQASLAGMYLNGEGTPKNLEKAYEWYIISAANGYSEAKLIIEELEVKLTKEQINKAQKYAGYWMPGGNTVVRENEDEVVQTSKEQPPPPAMQAWLDRNPWYMKGGKMSDYASKEFGHMTSNGWNQEDKKTYDELDRRLATWKERQ